MAPADGPSWRAALVSVAFVPLLGVGALFLTAALFHDCGEVRAGLDLQVFLTARRFQDAARSAGGTFPREDAVECRDLLAPGGEDWLDPWRRPLRYERMGEEGRRARVVSLGKDGEPGGEDCDEDIVWWVDLEDTCHGRDARVPPARWR